MGLRHYMLKGLFGYGVIGILNLVNLRSGFLRLGRNPDVLESNGSRIRFQQAKIKGFPIGVI